MGEWGKGIGGSRARVCGSAADVCGERKRGDARESDAGLEPVADFLRDA